MPSDSDMNLGELKKTVKDRISAVVDAREADAVTRVIMENVLNLNPTALALSFSRPVETGAASAILRIADRFVNGEPIQYILGSAYFHGLTLVVRKGVLIPRPETSALVDIICDSVRNQKDLNILDVGCGSGAISVTLARELPFCRVTAVDISEEAVLNTLENCKKLNVDNLTVLRRDILTDGLPDGRYDIIVSNPPYVDQSEMKDMERRVTDYEPHTALFVPDDNPLLFYRSIALDALHCLDAGGKLFFEINPRHSDELKSLLQNNGYRDIEIIRDFEGRNRYVTATL